MCGGFRARPVRDRVVVIDLLRFSKSLTKSFIVAKISVDK
jgi:hypothetical protein